MCILNRQMFGLVIIKHKKTFFIKDRVLGFNCEPPVCMSKVRPHDGTLSSKLTGLAREFTSYDEAKIALDEYNIMKKKYNIKG